MNTVYNTSTKDISEVEEQTLPYDHFEQLTLVEKDGAGLLFHYVATSKGETSSSTVINRYLSENKEALYLRALKNAFRKIDFIELNQALEMEEITEKDFDKELDEHEDQYLIPMADSTPSAQQVIQIVDIVKRLGRVTKMSVDEVSELFSYDLGKAHQILQSAPVALEA